MRRAPAQWLGTWWGSSFQVAALSWPFLSLQADNAVLLEPDDMMGRCVGAAAMVVLGGGPGGGGKHVLSAAARAISAGARSL